MKAAVGELEVTQGTDQYGALNQSDLPTQLQHLSHLASPYQ
jgi:hypothetical protein